MRMLVSFVFICLVVYLPTTTGMSNKHRYRRHPPPIPPPPPPPPPYTNIQFVQSWYPGYCQDSGSNCKPNLPRIFYTHGLWPADSNGGLLQNCKGNFDELKPDVLKSMVIHFRAELASSWRSISTHYDDLGFWVHQWIKHGVCSSQTIPLPKMYFRKGIDAKDVADMNRILSNEGIHPGQTTYTKDDFQNAIRRGMGLPSITIYITCAKDGTNFYLREVILCMDVHAKTFIPCPRKSRRSNRECGSSPDQPIIYRRS